MSRIVHGVGPVRELIRARRAQTLYVDRSRAQKRTPSPAFAALLEAARHEGVTIRQVDATELISLTGEGVVHQGVCARAPAYPYVELEELVVDEARVVVLDGIEDPHNLGACLRSAYLLGATGVVLPRDRSASITAVATKSSAGASELIAVAQVTNLARSLDTLREAGFWVAGLIGGPETTPVWSLSAGTRWCVVAGAEGKGIRPQVRKRCDYAVSVPMSGNGVGSLNVSVALGIALYELVRPRT